MAKSSSRKVRTSRPASASKIKSTPSKTKKGNPHRLSWWPLMVLGISILIVLQARIKLLAIPMERDEAGFAYIGHWLLNGKTLYEDFVDNKLPGLYTLYGIFTSLFGYNAQGVHLGLFFTSILAAVLFYYFLKDVFNAFVAAIATSFFIVLLVSPTVGGFAAHATQLLLPFVIGGWMLFWKGINGNRLLYFFLAGLLMGIAFLIKQQSIVFGILAASLWWPIRIWFQPDDSKKHIPFFEWIGLGLGGVLPAALTIGYFYLTDRLDELYFWTVTQPSRLAASFETSRWELFSNVFPKVIGPFPGIWIMAAIGGVAVWFSGFKKSISLFAALFALVGLASVAIGAAFYKHYFVVALPGVALLAALTVNWLAMKVKSAGIFIGCILALILILWPVLSLKEYFFTPDYAKIHQKAYNQNMFPELQTIGKELAKRVPPGQKIGVLGSEPGVLVAANRESCSKHLFMYPLLSDPIYSPAMQEEYIREMQECSPEYIVWSSPTGSWTNGYDQIPFFKQMMQWAQDNYVTTGIAEIRQDAPGVIVWDAAVASHQSQNNYKVYVFKKK